MQLQVEKDLEAERGEFVHDVRSVFREELQAELHPGELAGERREKFFRDVFVFEVDREDEFCFHAENF